MLNVTLAIELVWSVKSSGKRSVNAVPVPAAASAESHSAADVPPSTNFTASPFVLARLKPTPEKTKSVDVPTVERVVLIPDTPFDSNKSDIRK